MMYHGKTMRITADQVVEVRQSIGDNQTDFAMRFSRSRCTIYRWETRGVNFKYQSQRWRIWQRAVGQAINRAEQQGADHEYIKNLRELRVL